MDPALLDYELPSELIAQEPRLRRDQARLLVLPRSGGPIRHLGVLELPDLLRPGDLLVLNDTRVVPARLHGTKDTGGRVELLLLRREGRAEAGESGAEEWRCLVGAAKRPRPGAAIRLPVGVTARLVEERAGGEALVRFEPPAEPGPALSSNGSGSLVERLLATEGEVPLPPYVRRERGDPRAPLDRERYQTVYARHPGAVAAPTAGLHFTPQLMERIRERDVGIAYLTLHVGPGTFRPLTASRVEDHLLEPEEYVLPEVTAEAIARARNRGGRVVACGTTVVRVLEARGAEGGRVRPGRGECALLITPGHRFRIVDGLLTNFHLPRTSLLVLVTAFAGRDAVLAAYSEAIARRYRFYSYGDAMLIPPA